MYTHVHTVFLPSFTIFPHSSPSHWYPLPKAGPVSPLSGFVKEKKWHFCLFNMATQGLSLWNFRVYVYYNQNWFISIFLLSTLVPFLWWSQQV
jgi:hypothetical protein